MELEHRGGPRLADRGRGSGPHILCSAHELDQYAVQRLALRRREGGKELRLPFERERGNLAKEQATTPRESKPHLAAVAADDSALRQPRAPSRCSARVTLGLSMLERSASSPAFSGPKRPRLARMRHSGIERPNSRV